MRIFCAVRHSIDPQFYYGGLWSGNFYAALKQLGHEIVESQIDLLPTSRFMHIGHDFTSQELETRARTTDQILGEVRVANSERPVDLFLSYFYNAHFDPSGFDELRRLGIPSVNFFCNSIYQFNYVRDIAAEADFAWHAERDARKLYLDVGANPVWVQMGGDPQVYHPVAGIKRQMRACFIGQRYADRDRWMSKLIEADVPVDIYGPGWGVRAADTTVGKIDSTGYLGRPQNPPGSKASYITAFREMISDHGFFGGIARGLGQLQYRIVTRRLAPSFIPFAKGPIPFEKIAEVLAAHEVCLNFSNVWSDGRPGSQLIPHVRLRDFEAPMCRACYLTGENDEIREFYEVGKEIDTYARPDELVDKARFYLNHPEAAESLRDAGYRRAQRDHTWASRFAELFEKVGLSKNKPSVLIASARSAKS
jgi:spore maturation protein CgeB